MSDNTVVDAKLNDEALEAAAGGGWEAVAGFKAKQWVERTAQVGANGQIHQHLEVSSSRSLPGGHAERWDIKSNKPVQYK